MENKRLSFGYEDIYKKIEVEIFGLIFEINKEKIEDKDIKIINENDEDIVKREIEDLIGLGAIEKINNKAISDGYSKMTLAEEVKVLTFLYITYMNYTTNGMMDDINCASEKIEARAMKMKDRSNINREERRNYNKNQYRRNRRGYRRY